jgi:hypothetical protein
MRLILSVALYVIAIASTTSARSVSYADAIYWCGGATIQHSDEAYYSDAFESDDSLVKVDAAWNNYVKATYDLTLVGGCTTFTYYHSLSDARSERDRDAAFQRGLGHKVIMTRWTY